MSLRLRLNLLITALLLLFMIAVASMLLRGNKASIQEGVEAAARVTVQLLDTVVVSSIQNPEWGYTHDVMRRFLQHLGHVRGNEITLYDIRGNLIYKSPPSKYRVQENPPQWFSEMLAPTEKSVTRVIRYGKLVIDPNPSGAIREAWGKMSNLLFIGISYFIVLNAIVYWMLGGGPQAVSAIVLTSAVFALTLAYIYAMLTQQKQLLVALPWLGGYALAFLFVLVSADLLTAAVVCILAAATYGLAASSRSLMRLGLIGCVIVTMLVFTLAELIRAEWINTGLALTPIATILFSGLFSLGIMADLMQRLWRHFERTDAAFTRLQVRTYANVILMGGLRMN